MKYLVVTTHAVAAKSELLKENPDSALFSHVLAEVYAGLSNKEATQQKWTLHSQSVT